MRPNLVTLLASAAFALSAAPALAEEVTIRVPYGDLDIASDAGLAEFRTRAADAAAEACAPAEEWVLSQNSIATCQSSLTRRALAELERLREAPLP